MGSDQLAWSILGLELSAESGYGRLAPIEKIHVSKISNFASQQFIQYYAIRYRVVIPQLGQPVRSFYQEVIGLRTSCLRSGALNKVSFGVKSCHSQ